MAVQYALKGHDVMGVDISQRTVRLVNLGQEPFLGELNLAQQLQKVVESGRLRASESTETSVSNSDVVVVAVPLVVDKNSTPDFEALDSATRAIGQGLKTGTLVSFETTLPVGTTRNRLTPILEKTSGLEVARDFFVVFSPERVYTGRIFEDLRRYPKLVGGVDLESERRGISFYASVLDFDERTDLPKPNGVWALGTSEAAEMAKLAETTYRDVNIALANQFALYAEKIGVDVYQVIEACNSQPFSHIHQPGISVGGHCIPVYPHLYMEGDSAATLVATARAVNKAVPAHVVGKVESKLGTLESKRILILGLSYRAGVKESAFSGTWDLAEAVRERGGHPVIYDPLYSSDEVQALGFTAYSGENCDAAIMHTNHEQFRQLTPTDLPGVLFIADGRNSVIREIRDRIPTYVLGQG